MFFSNPFKFKVHDVSPKIEDVLDDAYVSFLEMNESNPIEESLCSEVRCVHVSELAYGKPKRAGGLEPQMVIGVEAERGLCWTAERRFDPNRISWVCPPGPVFRLMAVDGEDVAIIGNIDFLVYFPPSYFGHPVFAVGEKKTGQYRGNGYGLKKHNIALHQLAVYAWLFGTNLGVIQADAPRTKNGSRYLVTHEVYIIDWEREEFKERLRERVRCALKGKEDGKESWWDCLQSHPLAQFATRVAANSLSSFLRPNSP